MMPLLYPHDLVLAVNVKGRVHEGDIVVADVEGYSVIKRIQTLNETTASCILGTEHAFATVPLARIPARVIMVCSWHNGIIFV